LSRNPEKGKKRRDLGHEGKKNGVQGVKKVCDRRRDNMAGKIDREKKRKKGIETKRRKEEGLLARQAFLPPGVRLGGRRGCEAGGVRGGEKGGEWGRKEGGKKRKNQLNSR